MSPRWLVLAALCYGGCGGSPGLREGETRSGTIGSDPVLIQLDVMGPVEIELNQFDRDLKAVFNGRDFDSRETGPETVLVEPGRDFEIRPVRPSKDQSRWSVRVVRANGISNFALRAESIEALHAAKLAFDKGDLAAATVALEKARDLAERAGDEEAAGTAISYLGTVGFVRRRYTESLAQLNQARTMLERAGSRWILVECVSNLGLVHWRLGNLRDAESRFNEALALHASLGNPRGEAATVSSLGNVYVEAGEFTKALGLHDRAMKLAEASGDPQAMAPIFNNTGTALTALGKPAEAVAAFENARKIHEKDESRRASAARAALRIAEIQLESGQDPGEELTRARRLGEQVKDPGVLSAVLTVEGRWAARRSRSEAAALFQKALDGAGKVPSNRAIILHHLGLALDGAAGQDALEQALSIRTELGARERIAETLHALAMHERRHGRLDRARQRITAAIDAIDQVRSLVRGPRHRITYLAARQRYYAFAVDLLSAMGLAGEALAMAERGRSRVLLDQLGESAARLEASAAPVKAREKERIANRIRTLSARLRESVPGKGAREEIAELWSAYDRAESEVYASSPELTALTPRILDPVAMARLLGAGTALVQYFLDEPQSRAWIVDRSGVRLMSLPGRERIEQSIRECSARWTSAGNGAPGECLARLAGELFPRGLEARRVVVAPDGILHRLPFTAIVSGKAAEVVSVPSMSVLAALRARPRPSPKDALTIVADPVFDAADGRVKSARSSKPGEFRRLGYSRREAMAIAKIVPSARTRYDFDASRDWIAGGGLAGSGLLHIATHAVADELQPELSRLILSRCDSRGNELDGDLFLPDIAQLRLEARLVTLSACSAGKGARIAGEGPMHLARAFLHAGARAVVVSLWDVEDEAAAELMRKFYEHMHGSAAQSPAAALLMAQRDLSQNPRWRHPFYWAGWTYLGDWQ